MLGTLGNVFVHSCNVSSCCLAFSTLSALVDFRLDRRDSDVGRFSVLGAPTCFTDDAGIADEPSFGGTGGFEEECLR